jgi:phage-related minor tail protein
MRPIRTLIALAFVLALSSAATRAQDQSTGDPVADAARRAREQRKAAPKPKKVFTDDDVKPAEAPAPPSAASSDSTSPSEGAKLQKPQAPGAQNSSDKEDPNSEKAWRKRFADQHKKISDAELELDVLQRELQKSDLQYYSNPQKAMDEQLTRNEINEKTAKIEAKKKQIADLKQQLSDLEDQLRASGGDAGWAR